MDNLCHTLAGLAIGETGLKRRTAMASATLMIGANLPDVDGFVYFLRPEAALGFRRGWTHGILAMALWPLVLAGVMLLVGRLAKRQPDPRGLLLLSAVAVWSHPLLDLMNVYGVRLLMPFSQRWFYADTLFIVDPWIWIALTLGIVLARRAQRTGRPHPFRPMRVTLVVLGAYLAAMAGIGMAGRAAVRRTFGEPAARLMVGPVPLNPLRREFIAAWDTTMTRGTVLLGLLGLRVVPIETFRTGDRTSAAIAAAADPTGLRYLRWARFPFFETGPGDDCPAATVCIHDLRYYPASWAEVAIPIRRTLSSSASTRAPELP